jgi:xanthine/uracil permease
MLWVSLKTGVDIIYGLDDKPPVVETIFAALQHLLAIFVPILTPTLIISGALKLDLTTSSYLISMALLAILLNILLPKSEREKQLERVEKEL